MVRSSPWSRAKFNNDISLCEPADAEVPEVPLRSWAYHLAPIGIGTPSTESLASYFIRLAESHLVTPRAFFNHSMSKARGVSSQGIYNYSDGLVSPTETGATPQVNGSGSAAEKWVHSLEELTQQNNLRFLTFLPWKNILSNRTMHRRARAWCTACLEDQRLAAIPVHEQLRWAHRIVVTCPDHKIRLETECHHCKSSSSVLCGSSRPGLCSRCKGWLGYYPDSISPISAERRSAAAFEIFVAEQIGELIGVGPGLAHAPELELPSVSIAKCVNHFFNGNMAAFIKYFGLKKGVALSLSKNKFRYINLELLSNIAFRAGTHLLNLLTDESALDNFEPLASGTMVGKRLSSRFNKQDILKVLLAAVEERPAPSLNQVARRFGYCQTYQLHRDFPQVCDQIKANYQAERKGSDRTPRLQSSETILAALKAALKKESPPSTGEIARSLGYATSQPLRSCYPDVCKAIAEKRQKLRSSRKAMIEVELRAAMESDPPVTLNTISEKLGYKTTSVLRTTFPAECREIRQRHEEHISNQLLSSIKITLQSILIEVPPPPLIAALRRLGVSDGFLRKYFIKEHRAISARYLKFRQQQSMKNKKIERSKIRSIVFDLIGRGIFPSMDVVLELFPTTHLKLSEVWATILAAREEFTT